jgi:hypothetical protein
MQRALVGTRILAELVGAFILVIVAVHVRPAFRLLSPTASIHTDAGETAPFAGISVEGRSGCASSNNDHYSWLNTSAGGPSRTCPVAFS